MILLLIGFALLPPFMCAPATSSTNNNTHQTSERSSSPSLGDAVVNVQHFTQFIYEGNQIYVYGAKLNDEYEDRPLKWSFYYVPVLQPIKSSDTTEWVWSTKKEVRMKLMLGSDQVEDAARRSISRRFNTDVASNYSRFWVVAPLMIDSMTAFIVKASGDPVEGVAPFRLIHPSALAVTFRYQCSHENTTHDIVEKLIDGDYEVEVNFYFAGFKHVSSNIASITGEHLKSVLSKTTADGGSSNAKYIHRAQANKFTGIYSANVKKLIYMEKPGVDASALTNGLDEQFQALFQQGMDSATQIQVSAKHYNQVWHSDDLNPDRLTNELNKLFTLNDTATQKHNNTDKFFNVNSQSVHSSSSTSSSSGNIGFKTFSASGSHSQTGNEASSLNDDKTTHDILSASDIQHRVAQDAVEIEWTGEKFVPKSFWVFKLTDLTDKLQVAIISKHMFAEKQNGAISRRVSALNSPIIVDATRSSTIFTGEIRLFAGASSPPFNWLICDGALLPRIEYSALFNVIGTLYGKGDEEETHFRLPDFRGRFPLGVDKFEAQVAGATQPGFVGGQALHQLTVEQLPSHQHGTGSLSIVSAGAHTHGVTDPGHNHGGKTGMGGQPYLSHPARGDGTWGFSMRNDYSQPMLHDHTIAHGYTHISINSGGLHSHGLEGTTSAVGTGQQFSIMPPYQAISYIIYTA